MKKVLIDRSHWRNARQDRFAHSFGETFLLNDEGYSCCLGFACQQLGGVQKYEMNNICFPSDLNFKVTSLNEPSKRYESCFVDTRLSQKAIHINDDRHLSDEDREKALKSLFSKYSIKLEFTGEFENLNHKG